MWEIYHQEAFNLLQFGLNEAKYLLLLNTWTMIMIPHQILI